MSWQKYTLSIVFWQLKMYDELLEYIKGGFYMLVKAFEEGEGFTCHTVMNPLEDEEDHVLCGEQVITTDAECMGCINHFALLSNDPLTVNWQAADFEDPDAEDE